ncbi:MAG: UbiA family prenyltransferase [Rhodanobacteraceae bacterium]
MENNLPLCVDLDGTLIKSDLLVESALMLLRRNPLYLLRTPVWLLRGKANLKREIARRSPVEPALLPYREDLLAWLRAQAGERALVLCTASDGLLAEPVAAHLGCFSKVLASDGRTNLSGRRKAERLVLEYGDRGFDYIGNERADLEIWSRSRHAVLAGASSWLERTARKRFDVTDSFPGQQPTLRIWLKALRLHQWAKNLLVFLPLLAAHRIFDLSTTWRAIAAWAIFGLCASGVYVLNDLLDLAADRAHPRKRRRAFASGALSLTQGIIVNAMLTVVAFAAALVLSPLFALVLLGYWLLTNAYSLTLKRQAIVDVLVLAGLYTLRILAGATATRIAPSFWLLAFSMFFFLSLAILKRYTELETQRRGGLLHAAGRGYHIDDLPLLTSLGVASGYLSVLVLALYIQSGNGMMLYQRPAWLWLWCPLLLYWISRAWFIAHRGHMHDDPVVFALRDRISRAVLALCVIIALIAVR